MSSHLIHYILYYIIYSHFISFNISFLLLLNFLAWPDLTLTDRHLMECFGHAIEVRSSIFILLIASATAIFFSPLLGILYTTYYIFNVFFFPCAFSSSLLIVLSFLSFFAYLLACFVGCCYLFCKGSYKAYKIQTLVPVSCIIQIPT